MALRPRDADLPPASTWPSGCRGVRLVQFVQSGTAVPGDTLSLRLSPDGSGQATAPELGLLQPSDASAAPVDPRVTAFGYTEEAVRPNPVRPAPHR